MATDGAAGARLCALQGWRARPAAWRRQHGCCRV